MDTKLIALLISAKEKAKIAYENGDFDCLYEMQDFARLEGTPVQLIGVTLLIMDEE
jgi:hypothetical protein